MTNYETMQPIRPCEAAFQMLAARLRRVRRRRKAISYPRLLRHRLDRFLARTAVVVLLRPLLGRGLAMTVGFFVFAACHLARAEEATKVSIRKVNGRTEAVVTITGEKSSTAEEEKNKVEKTFHVVEEGAREVMDTSNELVGRGTDQAVQTVQSVGDSMLSWFFRMLDFRKASESKDQ